MTKQEEAAISGFGWLPEDIIHRVLSFLCKDDKQKTRGLSKQWFNAYVTYPKLCFYGKNKQHFDNTLSRHMFGGTPLPYQLEITLDFNHDDDDTARILDKWLKIAVENGVKELNIRLRHLYPSGYIVPDYILGSKSLKMLSLFNCEFPDKLTSWILCKNIHTLVLLEVSIKDDIFSSMLMSCPLIEYLRVEICPNLNKVELINVPCLKELHITGHFIRPEPIFPLKYQPYFVEPQPQRVHQNLRSLRFEKVILREAFFHNFANKFPHLKSLVIRSCDGFARMKLTSYSLANLEFESHFLQEQKLEINAPNLTSFCLAPFNIFPKVSFIAVSPRIKSSVSLCFNFPIIGESWNPRLNEMLSNLAPSKISLDITLGIKKSFSLEEEEDKWLEPSINALCDLFFACGPETINLNWERNERALHIVNGVQNKLVEMHNQNLIMDFRRFVFHANGKKCQKQPLDSTDFSDVECKDCKGWKEIRFDIGWNLHCCSGQTGDEPTNKRFHDSSKKTEDDEPTNKRLRG
ncbi:OLC1v1020284C1 [Oldenlandia corymbosa var. corymbosa]|uniref:OLC1v1020284C1 n=1 Tax=Oldenlandia corymbosa var. corymbosa TaxID=529605 RepID=A0AAV1EG19_OLDCO|nr:OLC1v1020284C1 [Oldenlandia corymbosa var. corymbosa]